MPICDIILVSEDIIKKKKHLILVLENIFFLKTYCRKLIEKQKSQFLFLWIK